MSGMINPLFDGLKCNICGHFNFPFSTLKLKFTTVHILEIKESGTCQM